jgi:protein transport protein SEC61 subunit gamma and related proteins
MTGTSTFSILRRFPSEASRILKLSKKPTRSEFDDVAKVTGLGIVILGVLGLVFVLVRAFLEGKFA